MIQRTSCPRPAHRRFLSLLPGLTLLVLPACDPEPPGTPGPDLVLTDVNLVDVEAGEVLPGRTLSLLDGRIAAITTNGEEAASLVESVGPERTVHGRGRYLIPGLWDMHVHFRGGEELVEENRALLPLYIATGVTTVRDGGGDITSHLLEWRREIRAGHLMGPRILTSGPKIDGPTGGWDGSIRLTEPGQVAAALDSLEALGVDYVKVYDGTTPGDVYLEILEEATRRDLRVTGHMPYTVRFRDAVQRGLDGTEHLYYVFKGSAANEDEVTAEIIAREGTDRPLGFWSALSRLIPAHDDVRARETYRMMAEHGTAAVPTLHIMQVLSWVDEEEHSGDPELRFIPTAIEDTYAGRVQSARRSSTQARAERRELQRMFVAMVQPMHEAGVMILAGSDAGPFNSYVYPGFGLHSELEELVAAGLSPADALRSATLHAATFMGYGHELGHIAEGYRGELVLLDADPLEDVSNTRSIAAVILDGRRVLDSDELRALLEDVARP